MLALMDSVENKIHNAKNLSKNYSSNTQRRIIYCVCVFVCLYIMRVHICLFIYQDHLQIAL